MVRNKPSERATVPLKQALKESMAYKELTYSSNLLPEIIVDEEMPN